jgi:DNA segregation ATPase FtsK/SpoIIIE-like protein
MKTITKLFNEAWKKKEERGWQQIYIMVDLHGVVFNSNYRASNELRFAHLNTMPCLSYLSNQRDVVLILWTSSHETEIQNVLKWLGLWGIQFKYVNENPLEKDTEYASFAKKPYFNIVLDDKAGFDSSHDWSELLQWCSNHEMDKLYC